jgi:small subunit ribosomal protein S5
MAANTASLQQNQAGEEGEVIGAIQKGVAQGKRSLIEVSRFRTTVPHPVKGRAGSSSVFIRPASEGTGVIAGGAARAVLELAGIEDVLSKSLGSNSPLNVARATIEGLQQLRTFREIAESRDISVKELLNL